MYDTIPTAVQLYRKKLSVVLKTLKSCTGLLLLRAPIGKEGVPKVIINSTINLFFKLQSAFWLFQTITVSECCLAKLLLYYTHTHTHLTALRPGLPR